MGKSYYIDQAETQANELTNYCVKIIEGMQESMKSLENFRDDAVLQGKTYDSAKSYVMDTYYPVAKGIIEACEEIIRQNKDNPQKFRDDVANTNVIEDNITSQIDASRRQRQQIEDINNDLPIHLLDGAIDGLYAIEKKLNEKIEDLYTYDSATQNNWNIAEDILSSVKSGLSQISEHGKFDSKSGTFSDTGMDFSWENNINDIWNNENTEFKILTRTMPNGVEVSRGQIYVNGVLSKEKSEEFDELVREQNLILPKPLDIAHFAGEFILIDDLYRLVFGKDWLSGEKSSRAEAAAWLALTVLPVSKLSKILKEVKAGNKLLKGVDLTEKDLKVLNDAGYFGKTGIIYGPGSNLGKMGTIVEHPEIKVDWSKYSEHGMQRLNQRGLTKNKIEKFIKNGKVLSQNGGKKFAFITKDGVAVVSKDGKLVTAWGKKDFDKDMKELIKKLYGE